MKSMIKPFIPLPLLRFYRDMRDRFATHARYSFSQEGEDIILERFIENRHSGFYVDIGAHHPKRFSNTYRLYLRGWRGLNVDATPGSMSRFNRVRPRDINVEAAVSAGAKELTFYAFNEPALNTFNKEMALSRVNGIYQIVQEIHLRTHTLAELLDQYVPPNVAIDLLTIDIEGYDYEVLQSNNWQRYKPEFIFVECLNTLTIDQAHGDPIAKLLSDHGYSMVAKTMNSVLFTRSK